MSSTSETNGVENYEQQGGSSSDDAGKRQGEGWYVLGEDQLNLRPYNSEELRGICRMELMVSVTLNGDDEFEQWQQEVTQAEVEAEAEGEEEFVDDDGTLYKWNHALKVWVPQENVAGDWTRRRLEHGLSVEWMLLNQMPRENNLRRRLLKRTKVLRSLV
ncbi:hypothetical protein MLD38_015510 [Melastoma candidum]|uniref:Uncharacterized protein n=1 Tax=Melastoma candidum TaxID=119954 RepID=A0ACB9RGY0_9MYRT|nr:hypothetical protein MLD38_015510 [Melastoma candidum]